MKIGRPKGCITTGEAAKRAGVTHPAVMYWIKSGKIASAKDPANGYHWIREKDFDAFLKSRTDPKRLKFKKAKRKT